VYVFHPVVTSATVDLALSPTSIAADGVSTTTATATIDDTSGNPVQGEVVTLTSSGGQAVGPITEGATPGTYQATITSTTAGGLATITAADTSVAPNAAASATLTQTAAPIGPPPVLPPAITPLPGAPPLPVAPPAPAAAAPPSNAFTITGATSRSDGTLVLVVTLPGPGTVALLGTHEDVVGSVASLLQPGARRFAWGRSSVIVARADALEVTLRPDRNGMLLLARHRRDGMTLNVTVWVTYTPTAGSSRSSVTTIRVLRARRH
jgi:hypothetical protein